MAYKGLLRLCGTLSVGVLFIAVVWSVIAAPQDFPFSVYIPSILRQPEPFTAYTGLITSDRDGDDDVYLIQADGQNLRARTVNNFDDNNPLWSPNASRFLFEQATEQDDALYVADTIGSEARLLAGLPGDDSSPGWSADGQMVAFINHSANSLYFVSIEEGSTPQRIAANVSNYTWSPVSNALLLTILREEADNQFVTDLLVITDTAVTTPTLLAADIQNYAWSSDGNWVVFTATREGDDEVYVSSLDGQSGYQVTTNEVNDTFAGWAEGGASVLITRDTPDGRQLYIVAITGENEEPIAVDPGMHYVAGIRDDGKEVVYGRIDQDSQYLYVQPVRGGVPTLIAEPLCSAGCRFINVSWSSDDERLVYQTLARSATDEFENNIYIVRFDTAIPTYGLLSAASDTPMWLPGTHALVYYHESGPRLPPIAYTHDIDTGQRIPLGAQGERVQVFGWRILSGTTR